MEEDAWIVGHQFHEFKGTFAPQGFMPGPIAYPSFDDAVKAVKQHYRQHNPGAVDHQFMVFTCLDAGTNCLHGIVLVSAPDAGFTRVNAIYRIGNYVIDKNAPVVPPRLPAAIGPLAGQLTADRKED
jgi:hypothetical protein